ncbi:centriolar coiled-coil protein of 110 kDa-like [Brienomyrus brachyistius]|uniref:centriolar coiled-coil protein of 110 kDa-like n=1 Tax=Brienomyrus brachyistius TaxID=42636 RepID=UPI0020B26FF8|nr:centriolar coiled-coil protein of 110 kDa-like [Brienomyrus brachyistius]
MNVDDQAPSMPDGGPRMESYEEFCSRSLAKLQMEAEHPACRRSAGPPVAARSSIRFHGMAVLSPLLSVQQRLEMKQHRQKALKLESERQSLRRAALLARVQSILDSVKVRQTAGEPLAPPAGCSQNPDPRNALDPPPEPRGPSRNGLGSRTAGPGAEEELRTTKGPVQLNGAKGGRGGGEEEEEDSEGGQSWSLQVLLRHSKELLEEEQDRKRAQAINGSAPTSATAEEAPLKGNKPSTAGTQPSFSPSHRPVSSTQPHPSSSSTQTPFSSAQFQPSANATKLQNSRSPTHNPLGSPQLQSSPSSTHSPVSSTQPMHSPTHRALSPVRVQPSSSPDSFPDSLLGCMPHSLTGSYAQLPCPEPSLSPLPHRRRPRPVSAGNILISCPMSAAELSPQKAPEGQPWAAWGPGVSATYTDWSTADQPSTVDSLPPSTGSGWPCSPSCLSSVHSAKSPPTSSPLLLDGITPDFRRHSQTLDSQLCLPHQAEQSQQSVLRFPCRQPQLVSSRRSPPAPLNQSYDVESPSPLLQRPHVDTDPTPRDSGTSAGHQSAVVTPEGRQDPSAGKVQWQLQALEELQWRLWEDHAQQLSLLRAEKEREQQRLQQLEEDRRPKEQSGRLVQAEATGHQRKALNDSCPLSPMPLPDGSPGLSSHSTGYSSFFSSSDMPSLAVQSPAYLRGTSWGGSKPRGRHSEVMTPEQQRALCRVGAMARGFLTRRLLNTAKLKHLRQTVKDTQEFIRSFQKESPAMRSSLCTQDFTLQERVQAQLRAALFDVHDIFFVMPLRDRLALLRQDRDLKREKKLREMEKARSSQDKVTLSTATQKSMDRKKQRVSNAVGQCRKSRDKPKSPMAKRCGALCSESTSRGGTPSPVLRNPARVLQPNQGQNAPRPGQLPRHGSLYRRKPEERVKRCDSLRRQHSLG